MSRFGTAALSSELRNLPRTPRVCRALCRKPLTLYRGITPAVQSGLRPSLGMFSRNKAAHTPVDPTVVRTRRQVGFLWWKIKWFN